MSAAKHSGLVIFLIAALSGCGKDPQPMPNAAAPDALAPRYEASLSEGIDFTKPGYPGFLVEVSGMSGHEAWGRWTDGPVAKFRFQEPLPGKFTLLITAGAIGPNYGNPVAVRAGKVEKEFTVTGPVTTTPPGVAAFSLEFEGVDGTDTIELVPPSPVRPKDMNPNIDDERMLGVGIVSLKIQ